MIISISGKAGSGKDTVGKIIQYLTAEYIIKKQYGNHINIDHSIEDHIAGNFPAYFEEVFDWKIKKYSDKLKDIVCILIGCTREQLEDQTFKETSLGEEWDTWRLNTVYTPETLDSESFEQYEETSIYSSEKDAIEKGEEIKNNLHIPKEKRRYGMSADFFYEVLMEKTTPRILLQKIGTDLFRNQLHPNIWLNSFFSNYTEDCNWIITDSRFKNDKELVEKMGGITIRVNRKSKVLPCVGHEFQHSSETELDNETFKYVIENDGTIGDLIEKVREILIKENII
jgi:hypothetical protein